MMGGSYGRGQTSLQWGKQVGNWASYIAVEGVTDNGFREHSGSTIRRIYGDIGYKGEAAELHLNVGGASNEFGATAAAPFELLQQNWSSIYTWPQTSANQVAYVNATANVDLSPTWSLQANAYLRAFFQRTVDGNSTNAAPCASNPALLCYPSVSDPSAPANGLNGNAARQSVLEHGDARRDRPHFHPDDQHGNERSGDQHRQALRPQQPLRRSARASIMASPISAPAPNSGRSCPTSIVAGSGVFLGPSGDPVADGPVSLRATNAYTGLFAADTLDVTEALAVTAGARLNVAEIRLQDQLGTALNGQDTCSRISTRCSARRTRSAAA